MALREELDNYNAKIVVGPEDDPQETNAQLAVEEWNRTTVADGAWLQQNAIGPLSARDIVLANAIDDTNDALSALSAQVAGLDGRSLKSVNGRFFSGGEAWEGSKDAVVPDGTFVNKDETVYIPKNDEVILSMNDDGGHTFQLQLKPNEIGYRRLAGSNTAEAEGDYPDTKYKYDTQAGNFRSLVMNATESGNFVVTSAGLQKLECDDVTVEMNEDGKLALKDGPGLWFTSNDDIDKTGFTQEDGFYHGSNYKLKSIYANTIASDCSGSMYNGTMNRYSYSDVIANESELGGFDHSFLNANNSSADSFSQSLVMLANSKYKSSSENIVNLTNSEITYCNNNIIDAKSARFDGVLHTLALANTSQNAEPTTIKSVNHSLLAVLDSTISATYYAMMIGEDLTAINGGASYSVLMGKNHTVSGDTNYNYINGVNNAIMNGAQYGMFAGSGNVVSGAAPNNIVNGDENKLERSVSKNFVLGNKNSLHDSVNHDIILGDENELYYTSDVIIAGNKNSSHNTVINSLIFGNENELQNGISGVGVFGDSNSLSAGVGYSLALGNNIEMSHRYGEAYQKYAVGMGENIKVKGNYKHVAGDNTQAWNHYQLVLGKDAEDVASASVLVGNHSKIACTDNAVLVGDHTFVSTSNSMAVGTHNLIMGPASFAAGRGLCTRNAGQVMFGQYAVSYVDSMLEIGMGSEDQTRTVFRIDKYGNVWITGELHCGNISAGSVTTGQSAPVMNGGVAYYNDATTWSAPGYSGASAWIAQ